MEPAIIALNDALNERRQDTRLAMAAEETPLLVSDAANAARLVSKNSVKSPAHSEGSDLPMAPAYWFSAESWLRIC